MDKHLDLNRRFGLLTNYTTADLFTSDALGKHLTWDEVLNERFSIIVGRANFGKTTELKAKSKALRVQGKSAIYIALHKALGEDNVEDALETEERDALSAWKLSGGKLTVFIDSLDEASLGTEDGIRKAMRRLSKALDWPNSDVGWVLSSRPAVLTEDVLELLQSELRTTLYKGDDKNSFDDEEFEATFTEADAAYKDDIKNKQKTTATTIGNIASTDAASKTKNMAPAHDRIKLYQLLPLDKTGAVLYLGCHLNIPHPMNTLNAARQYGLGRLTEGPGGLDILAYIDPFRNPPQSLTRVFEKMVNAVQQQQRTDPRERRVGNPPPENLEEAIERLACASVVCQLPNIELSIKALRYRDGVLSARPIIASLLSEQSLAYLLGSRLFIDSGQHQVKIYPDELLPFLAAKRLASLIKSPEHARRLLANFSWRSTTGECGVYQALLPLAGWLSVFSVHCRKELLNIEPQAVAFFGDMRNPQIQLDEASIALERTIERIVSTGDSLGRAYYTLTGENYWQAAKPGIEPVLKTLFVKYGSDWQARNALLHIARHAHLDVFRDTVLDTHNWNYSKLLNEVDKNDDLYYILSLGKKDDYLALSTALHDNPELSESCTADLVKHLAWKTLDARAIAEITTEQFRRGRECFTISWTITHDVAADASDTDLYRLTRSFLLQLMSLRVVPGRSSEQYRSDEKFVELTMDLLALVITRSAIEPSRAAKLCLALNRLLKKHHHGNADKTKLRKALRSKQEVRLGFLRGLIQPTDKTANAISQEELWYGTLYSYVEGDEVEIDDPGFTELLLETQKNNTEKQLYKPAKRSDKKLTINEESKETLLGTLDEIRNASNEKTLAWAGRWLSNTTE
ncbi:hypothetical protein ACFL2V_15300, partial [Pseudomonadota bacterium]